MLFSFMSNLQTYYDFKLDLHDNTDPLPELMVTSVAFT